MIELLLKFDLVAITREDWLVANNESSIYKSVYITR